MTDQELAMIDMVKAQIEVKAQELYDLLSVYNGYINEHWDDENDMSRVLDYNVPLKVGYCLGSFSETLDTVNMKPLMLG